MQSISRENDTDDVTADVNDYVNYPTTPPKRPFCSHQGSIITMQLLKWEDFSRRPCPVHQGVCPREHRKILAM